MAGCGAPVCAGGLPQPAACSAQPQLPAHSAARPARRLKQPVELPQPKQRKKKEQKNGEKQEREPSKNIKNKRRRNESKKKKKKKKKKITASWLPQPKNRRKKEHKNEEEGEKQERESSKNTNKKKKKKKRKQEEEEEEEEKRRRSRRKRQQPQNLYAHTRRRATYSVLCSVLRMSAMLCWLNSASALRSHGDCCPAISPLLLLLLFFSRLFFFANVKSAAPALTCESYFVVLQRTDLAPKIGRRTGCEVRAARGAARAAACGRGVAAWNRHGRSPP